MDRIILSLEECLERIKPIERSFLPLAARRLDSQIRPAGSLGYLEEIVARIVAIQRTLTPVIDHKAIYIFAADHGVACESVSLYPQEVTAQMVKGFLSGKATINVLARQAGAHVRIIDAGVNGDFPVSDDLLRRKVAYGTRNMTEGPAMSKEEMRTAVNTGIELAVQAKKEKVHLAAAGEMGIGNTTSASAVISAITGKSPAEVTGRGTGIDNAILKHKVSIIEKALAVNDSCLSDPVEVLKSVGGFEIAGMTGLIIGCAMERIPVVIDGLISSAAALVAHELHPSIQDYVFFGHRSSEPGQQAVLKRFGARPVLDLDMRLGEGSGACLALSVIEAAVRVFNEVATFEEAAVSGRQAESQILTMGEIEK